MSRPGLDSKNEIFEFWAQIGIYFELRGDLMYQEARTSRILSVSPAAENGF